MLCDNTFLHARRLFNSPISSWLSSSQSWEETKVSLFQHPEVHKEPGMGQNHSVSPLLPPRQHLSKTCLHLHLYCCFWMFHAQTWRACFCVYLLVSTKMTAALSLASQLTLKIVLESALLTFTQKSLHLCKCTAVFISFRKAFHCGTAFSCGAVILLLRAWCCSQVPHILLRRTPTVGLVLLCGAVSAQILRHVLLDRVALYSFLSCLWRNFRLTESVKLKAQVSSIWAKGCMLDDCMFVINMPSGHYYRLCSWSGR